MQTRITPTFPLVSRSNGFFPVAVNATENTVFPLANSPLANKAVAATSPADRFSRQQLHPTTQQSFGNNPLFPLGVLAALVSIVASCSVTVSDFMPGTPSFTPKNNSDSPQNQPSLQDSKPVEETRPNEDSFSVLNSHTRQQ